MNLVRRFPSIHHASAEAGASFMRFPLVMLCALVASVSAVYLVEIEATAHTSPAYRLLMAAALGVPLFFALTIWAERSRNRSIAMPLASVIGVVLLAAYYFSLPPTFDRPEFHVLRFVLLAAGLHFLVAFLPYLRSGEVDGFWQFNKSLFIRFLTAALYSAVLFAGLAIALAAVDKLFGVDIEGERYPQLFFVIAGVFNTWFFLAGVPSDLAKLNESADYPTGLKVFTQYILLPLVALYFAILIVYEAKILATWNWPKGWVSELVLWYSVVGILSLLLLFPLQRRTENRWITAFGRWFFRGLIPLVVMLFLAIYQRIAEYGVTVPRYLVAGMAVGLAVVVLYFVFGKRRDIRIIPIVLCALALLATYGPQSAFSVSRASQRHRLEALLHKHGILVDGRVEPATGTIPLADRRQMSSMVDYLAELDGPAAFGAWFPHSMVSAWQDSAKTHSWRQDVTLAMGFEYASPWRTGEGENYFNFSCDRSKSGALAIAPYEYLVEVEATPARDSLQAYSIDGDSCFVSVDSGAASIVITTGATRSALSDSIRVDLSAPIRNLLDSNLIDDVAQSRLTFDAAGETFSVRLVVNNVNGNADLQRVRLDWIAMKILLKRTNAAGRAGA